MKIEILAAGLASFLLCLILHILKWRSRRPQNDLLALFIIFMGIPGIAVTLHTAWICVSGHASSVFLSEISAFFLLHLALSSAYIQSYPPAQAVSPSLEIMILVQRAMPKGLTLAEISAHFDNAKLVHTRFEDLVNTKLVTEKDGTFSLTASGRRLIGFFVCYRKILGLEFKGG